MNRRDAMLAAIGQALGPRPPLPAPPPVPLLGPYDLDAAPRVEAFARALGAVGGRVHHAAEPAALVATVTAILQEHGCRSFGCSGAAPLQPLRPALAQAGLREVLPTAPRADLLQLDVGITTAQYGIAETGTLVLQHEHEAHRLLSLLPPLHVCILPVARILATLGEALKTLPRPPGSAVTFVTGPSRTADIELQLVVGVHGPGALHVVLA